jgi:hypothetical protein
MIRTLLGSALPVLGLGAAAMLLGPDLVTGPRGEPMIVESPAEAAFQPASFDATACPTPLLLDREAVLADEADPTIGVHTLTLAFRYDGGGVQMLFDEDAAETDADDALVIVFDAEGRILTVDQPASEGCLAIEAGPGAAKI